MNTAHIVGCPALRAGNIGDPARECSCRAVTDLAIKATARRRAVELARDIRDGIDGEQIRDQRWNTVRLLCTDVLLLLGDDAPRDR